MKERKHRDERSDIKMVEALVPVRARRGRLAMKALRPPVNVIISKASRRSRIHGIRALQDNEGQMGSSVEYELKHHLYPERCRSISKASKRLHDSSAQSVSSCRGNAGYASTR